MQDGQKRETMGMATGSAHAAKKGTIKQARAVKLVAQADRVHSGRWHLVPALRRPVADRGNLPQGGGCSGAAWRLGRTSPSHSHELGRASQRRSRFGMAARKAMQAETAEKGGATCSRAEGRPPPPGRAQWVLCVSCTGVYVYVRVCNKVVCQVGRETWQRRHDVTAWPARSGLHRAVEPGRGTTWQQSWCRAEGEVCESPVARRGLRPPSRP